MKKSYFILAIFTVLISGSACEAQELTDAENLQVASFSKGISALQEVFEDRLRTRYDISSDEELVFNGFALSFSDPLENGTNTPVYAFSYGSKSSLIKYDAQSPFGKGVAYGRSYLVRVFPNDRTVQFFEIIGQN